MTTTATQKRMHSTDVGGEERRCGLCEAVGGQHVPHGDTGGRRGGDGNHDDGGVGDCHGDGNHDDGGVGYDDDSDDSFEAWTLDNVLYFSVIFRETLQR